MTSRAASLGLGAAVGGAVTGITLASDLLVGLVGVVPFLVAPLLLLALRRGRREAVLAGWAVALVAVAVTTAYGLTRLMRHWGFHVPDGVPGGLASLDQARRNAGILVTQLLELGNANLVAQPLGPALVPMAVLAMAVVGGLAVVLLRPAALARASAARAPGRPGTDAELVYVVFWAVSVGLLLVAFVGSTVPVNNTAVRYLGAVFAAVAACVPLAARSSPARRRGIALAVALFCAASAWSVHDRTQREAFRLPHTKDLPQVIALLDARGLRRGYSTYWDANAVTWQTGGRIQIAAVVENPTDVAPFRPNSIDAWYDGTAPEPTFFLVDPDPLVMAAPPGDRLPPPDEIIPVGRFTVLVYRDDIAARFAP
jgi:hypothetical protein